MGAVWFSEEPLTPALSPSKATVLRGELEFYHSRDGNALREKGTGDWKVARTGRLESLPYGVFAAERSIHRTATRAAFRTSGALSRQATRNASSVEGSRKKPSPRAA